VNPADIPRFKQLGVIASMQPSHAIGDLFFAQRRLGDARLKGAYAWESFLKLGVPVPGGSDAPVERGEPMIEFYAAVARKSLDGQSQPWWHPEEAVTREQALKMFTWYPAYAAFEEDRHGSIEVGKAADFTVFDQDIMTVAEPQILKTKAVYTIVGGEVVFQRQ
jgi:predicted amidohydrolase YtcJ